MSNLIEEVERFTDEIEGELEKKKCCGVAITRNVTLSLLCISVMFVLFFGMMIGFVVDEEDAAHHGGAGSGAIPTGGGSGSAPAPPRTKELLLSRLEPLTGSRIREKGTPEEGAMEWLVNTDPLQLDFEKTSLDELVQRYVLATLYFATNGKSWNQQYNFLSMDHVCLWHTFEQDAGVTCNDNNDVTSIKLDGIGMTGSIPPDLALIHPLHTLSLTENSLLGSFPSYIGMLTKLRVLDLRTYPSWEQWMGWCCRYSRFGTVVDSSRWSLFLCMCFSLFCFVLVVDGYSVSRCYPSFF
jgi:hypothetical protein